MQIDSTTLQDLSVFTSGDSNIFGLLDHTTTQAGREMLRRHLLQPPETATALQEVQDAVRYWTRNLGRWPEVISNGTLVMLEKFFESADSSGPVPGPFSLMLGPLLQKFLNRNEYFFTQFSLSHISDFLRGCSLLTELTGDPSLPPLMKRELEVMQQELGHPLTQEVIRVHQKTPYRDLARLSLRTRRELKPSVLRLVRLYARLDAYQSLARATIQHRWVFPVLLPGQPAQFDATGLFHPLLQQPVPYAVRISAAQNLLVLTGANMSGKTTFMRTIGVSALLAHIGCGVPASSLEISFLEGIITNMHVEDNLLLGESYFYAEVQRMKRTAERLTQPGANLVLMDELFKGTNVHDAFECTRAVMEGLLEQKGHLMILSTHLYEAAQHFRERPEMQYAYFVTETDGDAGFRFTYELKPGISSDRLGYRILKQAGVLDLLHRRDP